MKDKCIGRQTGLTEERAKTHKRYEQMVLPSLFAVTHEVLVVYNILRVS